MDCVKEHPCILIWYSSFFYLKPMAGHMHLLLILLKYKLQTGAIFHVCFIFQETSLTIIYCLYPLSHVMKTLSPDLSWWSHFLHSHGNFVYYIKCMSFQYSYDWFYVCLWIKINAVLCICLIYMNYVKYLSISYF